MKVDVECFAQRQGKRESVLVAITIGSNISSLNAQRRLGEATSSLSTIYERLSSGQRINQASDDAAGLAIADSLKASSRVSNQAIRNLNDAISTTSIAEGALNSLRDISIRQKELATQAANGSYTLKQRTAMDKEANALVGEFNRIVQTTQFNGLSLFDPAAGTTIIQAGAGKDATLNLNLTGNLQQNVGDGTFAAPLSFTAADGSNSLAGDFNGDGNQDIIFTAFDYHSMQIKFGDGKGNFSASSTIAGMSPQDFRTADVNGDGVLDLVGNIFGTNKFTISLGVGNGTFKASQTIFSDLNASNFVVADVNGDGNADIVAVNDSSASVSTLLGKGDGRFNSVTNTVVGSLNNKLATGDFNGDGILDLAVGGSDNSNPSITLLTGLGNGKFSLQGGNATNSVYQLTIPDPQSLPSNNADFRIKTLTHNFYVWFDTDGSNSDPYGDVDSIRIDVSHGEDDVQAAQLVVNALNGAQGLGDFTATKTQGATLQLKINEVGATTIYDDSGYLSPYGFAAQMEVSGQSNQLGAGSGAEFLKTGDFNNDGLTDIAVANNTDADILVFTAQTSGTFLRQSISSEVSRGIAVADFNNDGFDDIASVGSGGVLRSLLNLGNGTFNSTQTSYVLSPFNGTDLKTADFNNDGRLDLLIPGFFSAVQLGNGGVSTHSAALNLNTRKGALASISTIDSNLARIESQLGAIGAITSRFSMATANLQSKSENFLAAASRIADADVAQESSNLVRTQILQKAAASVLAQANQFPGLALKLLS